MYLARDPARYSKRRDTRRDARKFSWVTTQTGRSKDSLGSTLCKRGGRLRGAPGRCRSLRVRRRDGRHRCRF
jgi:hypothetical protein